MKRITMSILSSMWLSLFFLFFPCICMQIQNSVIKNQEMILYLENPVPDEDLCLIQEHLRQNNIHVQGFPEYKETLWITQNQAAILEKKSATKIKSLFTADLVYCIALAIENAQRIGLVHIDIRTDMSDLATFIRNNFSCYPNEHVNFCLVTRQSGYHPHFKKHEYNTQKDRINAVIRAIDEGCKPNQTPYKLKTIYTGNMNIKWWCFLHTLGISNTGQLFMTKLYAEPISHQEIAGRVAHYITMPDLYTQGHKKSSSRSSLVDIIEYQNFFLKKEHDPIFKCFLQVIHGHNINIDYKSLNHIYSKEHFQ